MEKWHERLKEIREKKGLSQGKFAREIKADITTINRYEAGRGSKKLTDAFLLKLRQLLTDDEIAYIETGKWPDHEIQFVEDVSVKYGKEDQITVPYHKDVYAAAGGHSDSYGRGMPSPVTFSRHFLNNFLGIYNLNGLSIINAAGDSMYPTIKSGELMFVYPVQNEGFKDGSIYVIMCGDALLVKRVWVDPLTKEYTLSSDNESVADLKLTIDESSDCRFVGRVVGHLDRV